jgi:phosphomannomutase
VIIRPSGTEPKIKAYLEVRAPVGPQGVPAARSVAGARLAAVAQDVRARLTTQPAARGPDGTHETLPRE